jgi:LacI family transcriptional regulator
VTCDDHAWLDAFSPRLTTVDFPKRELGEVAARLLIARIANRGGPTRTIRLKSAMRIRESCGCALRGAAALVATSR